MSEKGQNDPSHWRYRKNRKAGSIPEIIDEKNLIIAEFEADGIINKLEVEPNKEALMKLNREEQVAICKHMKIKGYSDLNEEGIIKVILKVHNAPKKRKGVTNIDTFKKIKKTQKKN